MDLVLLLDRDGKILYVSPTARDIAGYSPREIEGSDATTLIAPEDLPTVQKEMQRLLRGEPSRTFECHYISRDGASTAMRCDGVWLPGAEEFIFVGRGTVIEDSTSQQLTNISHMLQQIDRRLRAAGWITALRLSDVMLLEILLSTNSLWATYILSSRLAPTEELMTQTLLPLGVPQVGWAVFAGLAAILKILGLSVSMLTGSKASGILFRIIGLTMSGVFWILMGGARVVHDPETLFGFGGILLGLCAWWSVVRLVR